MSQKFVQKLSPEKKKIRELKYQLYTHGNTIDNTWASLIIDRNEGKTFLCGDEKFEEKNRIHLVAIIEGLNWIYNQVEQKYRKYIVVTLYCDNVYCVNILKEWLQIWIDTETLESKPNCDLLKTLHEIINKMKIVPKWTTKTQNEYSWMVTKKASEIQEI